MNLADNSMNEGTNEEIGNRWNDVHEKYKRAIFIQITKNNGEIGIEVSYSPTTMINDLKNKVEAELLEING